MNNNPNKNTQDPVCNLPLAPTAVAGGHRPLSLHRLWGNPQPTSSTDATFRKSKYRYHWMDPLASYPINYMFNDEMVILPSIEHYFQLERFAGHETIQQAILAEPSPFRCRVKANAYLSALNRPAGQEALNYDIECMDRAIFEIIAQHDLGLKLRATKGNVLIHDCTDKEYDFSRFWGAVKVGAEWHGENVLGCLWMQQRESLGKFSLSFNYNKG